ncbi:E3 SUMO-protein ligase KIAA1586-like, partial [Myzus persicae]|uniref:E3 SUMO-protein ligase KIAA1586-like n=1 Tax=Myzus persicae TaxID=13164 RepID=UPI000B931781
VCDNTIQLGIKVPWPSEWSYNQWVEKKNKYPWLICIDGKIGCEYCKSVGTLKTFQSKGVEISKEWCLTMIDGGSNTVKAARLTNLRHNILKHKTSKAHTETEKISQQKCSNLLSKAFQTGKSNFYDTTQKVFRSAYYISKYNRPYDDHSKLIELQQLNGLDMGTTLHSRYSSTNIISHIADKMKTKIVQNIIATSSKISILIDESTTVSSLSGMVVYVKASILNSEPVFLFLDLVELKSQTASNIVNQLIECLHTSGFTENFLVEHWVSFVTDGASVLLGKKNGVAVRLKEKYPLIFSWHCLNHLLELAVGDTLKEITATNHFKYFLDSLYSLYSRSPKNQIELREHCTSLNEIFLKIGKVLDVRWVASSFRTISVIWKIYPALYNHLVQASKDTLRDSKTKSKYSGL